MKASLILSILVISCSATTDLDGRGESDIPLLFGALAATKGIMEGFQYAEASGVPVSWKFVQSVLVAQSTALQKQLATVETRKQKAAQR